MTITVAGMRRRVKKQPLSWFQSQWASLQVHSGLPDFQFPRKTIISASVKNCEYRYIQCKKKLICCYLYCRWSLSGLCASVSLFPFDFVRAGVVSGGFKDYQNLIHKCYNSFLGRHEVIQDFFQDQSVF